MLESVLAELIIGCGTSTKLKVFTVVYCNERQRPDAKRSTAITASGIACEMIPQSASENATINPLLMTTRRKPKRRTIGIVTLFIARFPAA